MWHFDSPDTALHVYNSWRGYYASVLRWHDRLRSMCAQSYARDVPAAHELDDTLAFFIACFHVADWLESDTAVPKRAAKRYASRTLPLMICRDICNGVKHGVLTRQPSLRGFRIGREYRGSFFIAFAWDDPTYSNPAAIPSDEHRRTDLYRVDELACDCIEAWESFFVTHSLNPRLAAT